VSYNGESIVIEANLLFRRCVIGMWIVSAVTFVMNIYAGLTGNLLLIGIGLGVALSCAVAGIACGIVAGRTHAMQIATKGR
jgi:hypothetical protein